MLFDLKGKRRRAVQGTYLTLAILMGAGLVLFGIGSSVNGGLSDLFNGGTGSNQGQQVVQKRIDAAEKQLAVNPRNETALKELVRDHYQLATAKATSTNISFDPVELQKSVIAWQRYLAINPPKPDLALAITAVQAYSALAQTTKDKTAATRQWAGASAALELIAQQQPTTQNYLKLVQGASYAGQTRKADLAGKKAVELAPKNQRKSVQQQVVSIKAQAATQAGGGATTTVPKTGP
jgi:tetratricopeptide (TPR) repeat protein